MQNRSKKSRAKEKKSLVAKKKTGGIRERAKCKKQKKSVN